MTDARDLSSSDSQLLHALNGAPPDTAPAPRSSRRRRTLRVPERPTFEAFREDYSTVLGFYAFDTRQRTTTLKEMLWAGRRVNLHPGLLDHLSSAISDEKETLQLESAWASKTRAHYSPKTRRLNQQLLRALSAVDQMTSLILSTEPEECPRWLAAKRVRARAFPQGRSPFSHLPYRILNTSVAVLLQKNLLKDSAQDIEALDLKAPVERLRLAHQNFDAALQDKKLPVRFQDLLQRRRQGQHTFGSLVIQILGQYSGPSTRCRLVREAVFAPVFYQNERIGRSFRRSHNRDRKA